MQLVTFERFSKNTKKTIVIMIEKYIKICDKLEKILDDNENSHILQDKIYRKFINDIVSQKIKGDDILTIANLLKKRVVKYDKDRWYA